MSWREVDVRDLEAGDVLAKSVQSHNGIVMLEKNTVLTENYIRRLKNLGVRTVALKEKEFALPVQSAFGFRDIPHSPPDMERMRNNDEARKQASLAAAKLAESEHAIGRVADSGLEERFRKEYRNVLLEIIMQRPIAEELGVLLQTDKFLFEHSLQVSLLSCLIGIAKNYDKSRLFELTTGALLFDIGMTRLPPGIVKATSELSDSERELMRQHTIKGYEVLSSIPDVSPAAARCALLHHERYRGTGYPFGLKNKDIPEYAQIVGVADIYDALISPRHYRKPYTLGEAMEYLFASGNYDFDLELVRLFVRNVSMFPVSVTVKLSSGQVGKVVDADNGLHYRPVVRILQEADGTRVTTPYEIDLRDRNDLVIVQASMKDGAQF